MVSNSNRSHSGFSFSALLLIALGIVFLLNNFGLLPWSLWESLWKFWPILLILFGIEIVIGRTSSPKSLVILILLIFLVPIILLLNPLAGNPLATGTESFEKPLANLTKARLNFELQSANLSIKALPGESTKVFTGEVKYSQLLPKPTLREEKRLGEGNYTFQQPSQQGIPFLNNLGNKVNLEISSLIPFELKLKSNAGVANLNLDKLRIDLIEVETLTGSTEITFTKDYSTKAFIKTQAGAIKLVIPKEIAAIIKTQSNMQNITIDEKRFPKSGDFYRSTDFETNPLKVEVEISGQATSLEVK